MCCELCPTLEQLDTLSGRGLATEMADLGRKSRNDFLPKSDPLQLSICFQVLSLLAGIVISAGKQSKSFTSLTGLICFFTFFSNHKGCFQCTWSKGKSKKKIFLARPEEIISLNSTLLCDFENITMYKTKQATGMFIQIPLKQRHCCRFLTKFTFYALYFLLCTTFALKRYRTLIKRVKKLFHQGS